MIPGVLMQGHKVGRSISVSVNVGQSQVASFVSQTPPIPRSFNINQPSIVGLSGLYAKGKAIAVASAESVSVNRSFARPKILVLAVGEAASILIKKGHTAFVRIGQSITYIRRLPATIRVLIGQRVFSPQVQPGNLRATQVTQQVLEADNRVANLRATQVTIQVLRSQT